MAARRFAHAVIFSKCSLIMSYCNFEFYFAWVFVQNSYDSYIYILVSGILESDRVHMDVSKERIMQKKNNNNK